MHKHKTNHVHTYLFSLQQRQVKLSMAPWRRTYEA